jgi:hypothetical protein
MAPRTSNGRGNTPNNLDKNNPVSGFGIPLIAENMNPITIRILGLL